MPIIELELHEIEVAGFMATKRQAQNLYRGRKDAHGAKKESGLDLHFNGCLGEIALAKHLNVFWSGALGRLKASDVGMFQVRATAKSDGNLLLHDEDKDDDVFVLARVNGKEVDLRGFILCAKGKDKKYWTPDGAFPGWRACYRVLDSDINRFKVDAGRNF